MKWFILSSIDWLTGSFIIRNTMRAYTKLKNDTGSLSARRGFPAAHQKVADTDWYFEPFRSFPKSEIEISGKGLVEPHNRPSYIALYFIIWRCTRLEVKLGETFSKNVNLLKIWKLVYEHVTNSTLLTLTPTSTLKEHFTVKRNVCASPCNNVINQHSGKHVIILDTNFKSYLHFSFCSQILRERP